MKQPFRVALSISLLIGALLVLHLRSPGEAVPIRKPLDSFPSAVGEWQGREGTIFELDVLNMLKAKDYVMRRYQDPAGRNLWLFIGYWDSQRKGAQPHSPKNCLPGGGWEPLEASRVTIPLSQSFTRITVNRYLLQKDRDQLVVFYWYQSQGSAVAGEMEARVEMVKNSIVRHRTDGALVRISSPVHGSVQETSDRVVRYIQALYPILGEYLPD
jgi:EpsI family protein